MVTSGGWKKCYSGSYSQDLTSGEFTRIRDQMCTGHNIMMACRPAGATPASDSLTVLAWANRETIFSPSPDEGLISEGTRFYLNNLTQDGSTNGGWGFASEASSLQFDGGCDKSQGLNDDMRLCWFLNVNNGGWRCGSSQSLNGNNQWGGRVPCVSVGPQIVPPTGDDGCAH